MMHSLHSTSFSGSYSLAYLLKKGLTRELFFALSLAFSLKATKTRQIHGQQMQAMKIKNHQNIILRYIMDESHLNDVILE